MPITIKQNVMKIKDGSSYIGMDVLSETSTQEHVTAINDAGTAQMAAITAKGVETRDSIPNDYTALSNEVNDLKSHFDTQEEVINTIADYKMQLLDDTKKLSGHLYWINGSGEIVDGTGNNVANFPAIPVKAGVTYYYKNIYAYFSFLDDGTKARLSESTSNFVNGSFTPEADGLVYITINTGASAVNILTTGTYTDGINESTGIFGMHLKADEYIHLAIKLDGTGDYTNPVWAVRGITDSAIDKQYMLDVYPGTYHLNQYINSQEQQGTSWGLKLPDFVHMRGIGNRDDIVLDCSLGNDASSSAVEYTSTLNVNSNNSLENMTFTGTNVRYVVHDESSNTIKNWKRIVKNCRFVHNGNADGFWAYTGAWGEGCSSGSYSYFEDCIFENYGNYEPFGFHTNTSFESACTHIFKNCQFIAHYLGSSPRGSFMIDDIQCGKPINVEFIGCSFSRFIFIQNHNSSTDIAELNITGHANTPVYVYSYRPNVSTPKKIFAKFSDEVAIVYNPYATITAGRPLRYANYDNNVVAVLASNGTQVCGIALDDIPENGMGYMKFAGIVNMYALGITGINQGDRVGVVSYSAAPVTDGSYFARAVQNNVIKFC